MRVAAPRRQSVRLEPRRVFPCHSPDQLLLLLPVPSVYSHRYRWTIPSAALIAREEGLAALYKGFVPKVMRLGPGGGILLLVFDLVIGKLTTIQE